MIYKSWEGNKKGFIRVWIEIRKDSKSVSGFLGVWRETRKDF